MSQSRNIAARPAQVSSQGSAPQRIRQPRPRSCGAAGTLCPPLPANPQKLPRLRALQNPAPGHCIRSPAPPGPLGRTRRPAGASTCPFPPCRTGGFPGRQVLRSARGLRRDRALFRRSFRPGKQSDPPIKKADRPHVRPVRLNRAGPIPPQNRKRRDSSGREWAFPGRRSGFSEFSAPAPGGLSVSPPRY